MPSREDQRLWAAYRSNPSYKDAVVHRYLPLVKYVVARMTVTPPPGLDYEDLISFGVMGLLNAIDRFDPNRGCTFQTYAVPRIRGAVLDELRKCDWFSRTGREKVHRLERAMEVLLLSGQPIDDKTLKEELGVDDKAYREMLQLASRGFLLSLDEMMALDEGDVSKADLLSAPDPSAQELLENQEEVNRVVEALELLSSREQSVMSMYYIEDMTLKEIGLVLGVTESRVSQIHGKAMSTLRTLLRCDEG
ncbi:MAG: RNA polymerase subunit sigma-28 [Dethiosulfovibrio peptidovorans]|nr:MAG: RNA polymerase subunit sigma-28 [Dethiosulfovibrio peptidovorans]